MFEIFDYVEDILLRIVQMFRKSDITGSILFKSSNLASQEHWCVIFMKSNSTLFYMSNKHLLPFFFLYYNYSRFPWKSIFVTSFKMTQLKSFIHAASIHSAFVFSEQYKWFWVVCVSWLHHSFKLKGAYSMCDILQIKGGRPVFIILAVAETHYSRQNCKELQSD